MPVPVTRVQLESLVLRVIQALDATHHFCGAQLLWQSWPVQSPSSSGCQRLRLPKVCPNSCSPLRQISRLSDAWAVSMAISDLSVSWCHRRRASQALRAKPLCRLAWQSHSLLQGASKCAGATVNIAEHSTPSELLGLGASSSDAALCSATIPVATTHLLAPRCSLCQAARCCIT